MKTLRPSLLAALLGVLAVALPDGAPMAQQPATAGAATAAEPRQAPRPKPSGYLDANAPFDGAAFLPPYPAKGSAAEAYDIAAWREALAGTDSARWKQALLDDPTGLAGGLTQFQCALGVKLTTANAPVLMEILSKTQLDTHWATEKAKAHFKRPRPFADAPDAPMCLNVPPAMRSRVSTAYLGGHSTLGMTWGLILAELAPDRATQLMARVRDYSHSRLVCGIHYPSDLEAGHLLGAGLVARLHAEPGFRADMVTARDEMAKARKAATALPPECGIEGGAGATSAH